MYPQERRQWSHGADDSQRITELGAKAPHGVDDEVLIRDGVVDVAEGVGEALEAAAEITDGELALVKVVEVLKRVDGALAGVVEEEATHVELE